MRRALRVKETYRRDTTRNKTQKRTIIFILHSDIQLSTKTSKLLAFHEIQIWLMRTIKILVEYLRRLIYQKIEFISDFRIVRECHCGRKHICIEQWGTQCRYIFVVSTTGGRNILSLRNGEKKRFGDVQAMGSCKPAWVVSKNSLTNILMQNSWLMRNESNPKLLRTGRWEGVQQKEALSKCPGVPKFIHRERIPVGEKRSETALRIWKRLGWCEWGRLDRKPGVLGNSESGCEIPSNLWILVFNVRYKK